MRFARNARLQSATARNPPLPFVNAERRARCLCVRAAPVRAGVRVCAL